MINPSGASISSRYPVASQAGAGVSASRSISARALDLDLAIGPAFDLDLVFVYDIDPAMHRVHAASGPTGCVLSLCAVALLAGCSSDPTPVPGSRTCSTPAERLAAAMTDGPHAPAEQTPDYEKGLILPANSLPCVPVSTGVPQNECNHHGSTVAELADGSVAALWYHGEEEKSLDSRLVWSRYDFGSSSWTEPEVVFDDPGLSEGNPAIWVHEDGTIYVFFVTIYGGGWDQTHVRLLRSTDGGASWSAPETLREEYCWNARHRPLRLADGQLLLPLYQECLALPTFMRSSDDFASWQEDPEPSLTNHIGQIQPALIGPPRLGATEAEERISAITRDGTLTSRIHRMQSVDSGLTWSASEPIGLPNSGTSVDWVRLANDHVVVVFNDDPDRRFPLSVALSLDDGDSFVAVRDINAECAAGDCSYHYPSIMQSSQDGSLWVTYTHDRETIGYVRFNEAWLAEGTGTTAIGCAATETCLDGVCLRGCQSADECRSGEVCEQQFCRLPCDGGPRCEGGVCAPVSLSRCEG